MPNSRDINQVSEESKNKGPKLKDGLSSDVLANFQKNIPDELKKETTTSISLAGMFGMGRVANPIIEKITPEVMNKMVDGAIEDNRLSYKDKKNNRLFLALLILFVFVFVIILVILLKDGNSDLLLDIVVPLFSFVFGGFGGYGVGSSRKK